MKSSSRSRNVMVLASCVCALGILTGARSLRTRAGDNAATSYTRAEGALVNKQHLALLHEAEASYIFGPDIEASRVDAALIGKERAVKITKFTMAKAQPVAGVADTETTKVIARLYVDRDYPRLGLIRGVNYIVRIVSLRAVNGQVARGFEYVIVPKDVNAKMYYLKLDANKIVGHHPPEAMIGQVDEANAVLICCLDDPICQPVGHCGVSDVRDEYRGSASTLIPLDSAAQ